MAKTRAGRESVPGTRAGRATRYRIHRPKHAPSTPLPVADRAGRSYATLLGLVVTRTPDIVQTVREGLPVETFDQFVASAAMSSVHAAQFVNIPFRTLTRRRQEGRLTPDESDRLLRASRILGRAIDLFEGDLDEAKQWLARPQRAFEGARPFDVAGTEVGALAVERLIDQIEQGVFV